MKQLKQHTRRIQHEGRPVFIAWDLWFEIMNTIRHHEIKAAPLDQVFASRTKILTPLTDNLFYN